MSNARNNYYGSRQESPSYRSDTINPEYSVDAFGQVRRKMPGYKRPDKSTIGDGYTGYFEKPKDADGWSDKNHALEVSIKKVAIRGYTGFRPLAKGVISAPAIPSIHDQLKAINPTQFTEEDSISLTQVERDYSKFRQVIITFT